MNRDDPYDLQRFVAAQDAGGTYPRATAELRAGRKVSHWMWFVFPQIAGLGYSPTARRYAITSLAEARAYLAHLVLGPRLTECAAILAGGPGGWAGPGASVGAAMIVEARGPEPVSAPRYGMRSRAMSLRCRSHGTLTMARQRPFATFAARSACPAVGPLTPFSTVTALDAKRS